MKCNTTDENIRVTETLIKETESEISRLSGNAACLRILAQELRTGLSQGQRVKRGKFNFGFIHWQSDAKGMPYLTLKPERTAGKKTDIGTPCKNWYRISPDDVEVVPEEPKLWKDT